MAATIGPNPRVTLFGGVYFTHAFTLFSLFLAPIKDPVFIFADGEGRIFIRFLFQGIRIHVMAREIFSDTGFGREVIRRRRGSRHHFRFFFKQAIADLLSNEIKVMPELVVLVFEISDLFD